MESPRQAGAEPVETTLVTGTREVEDVSFRAFLASHAPPDSTGPPRTASNSSVPARQPD
jgi:hypothetical protein